MSGKRTRRPVQKLGDFEEVDSVSSLAGVAPDAGSVVSHATGSRAHQRQQHQRAGRANKKRDDRSALVEVWMCKNESGNKPSTAIKEEYAQQLRIRKDGFWDTMKAYALKSKLACLPDFEQIWHHMKDDKSDLLQDLRLQGVDFWWEQEEDEQGVVFYKPNTQNLKNFKPASGLLHHFYQVYIHDSRNYETVRHNPRATGSRFRTDPEELDDLVAKLSPFRVLPEPKALLVLPNSTAPLHQSLRGTYALGKKVNNHNVFFRPARQVAKGKGTDFRSVILNGATVDVPAGKEENYALVVNALSVLCKEERKDEGESEVFQDVPFRMRVPPEGAEEGPGREAGVLTTTIEDLGENMFDLTTDVGVMVYPVRGLLPIPEIMRFIDFGAVWQGCFSPFPRTAASFQEFVAQFSAFPETCLSFFFYGGDSAGGRTRGEEAVGGRRKDVLAEDYIRFMTWFANFDDGLGQACCNAWALYKALEGVPFYLSSQSEDLRAVRQAGMYAVRLSDTKPQCLTVEVWQQAEVEAVEEEDGVGAATSAAVEGTVLCFRVRVTYNHPAGGAAKKATALSTADGVVLPQVQFSLEDAVGKVSVTSRNRLAGPVLKKIEQQTRLPAGMSLTPLLFSEDARELHGPRSGGEDATGLGRGMSGSSTSSTGAGGRGRRNNMGPPAAPIPTDESRTGSRNRGKAGTAAAGGAELRSQTHKRKRGGGEDRSLPPPLSKMGTAGASAFNDETFDINGAKQLAAAQIKREVSNVLPSAEGEGSRSIDMPPAISAGLTGSSSGSNGAPLNMWGQHIPMPTVGRDHSLAPPPMMSGNSLTGGGSGGGGASGGLRQESIGKGDSWGSVLKNIDDLSPPGVNREHSLALGLPGFSRDMSMGSLSDFPRLSRGPSQYDESLGGAGEEGGGKSGN
ncbi:hypothetical protein Naga_100046g45 [Nannochloropsis gaditana]|uniref:Uncharacterized protein n=1 Tax=Nannochloropsis gaditana TaxID=72520 RepID=W7TM63_9STRA|nr:hypothetical protein Naga_100046g45 [Nannochloropsis gaditana]